METNQKAILRFLDGRMLKGFIRNFTLADDHVFIVDESSDSQKVKLKELKAIFFVRKFAGDREHREKKSFAGTSRTGQRLFVKFRDGEQMTGFLEGDLPRERGGFLDLKKTSGFFLRPVDEDSNNIKVFVVTSALLDVTSVG